MTADSRLTMEYVNGIGQIRVQLYRARPVQKLVPYVDDGKLPEVLDVIPEKMLKGRQIKNNTK